MIKIRNIPPTPEPVEIIDQPVTIEDMIALLEAATQRVDAAVTDLQVYRRAIQDCIMRLKGKAP